jgi:hypothetical protein
MKSIVSISALSALFAGSVVASPEFDNHANYGTVLQDLDRPAAMGESRVPTGDLVASIGSGDNYGSALFDRNRPGSPSSLPTQPSIGDGADDFGNILYDVGARY